MCGIAGFTSFRQSFENPYWSRIALMMRETLDHRGPDSQGLWKNENAVLAHTRLAVIDVEGGKQPMQRTLDGYDYVITYNGELYNTKELKRDLIKDGCEFTTTSDTEVLLQAYMRYGKSCIYLLNGIYAFAIWDGRKKELFACRDRFGVKPFFYSVRNDTFVFGSEIKALLKFPGIEPIIDKNGLCEVFGIGPARSIGNGVFKGINDLPAGHYLTYSQNGLKISSYFALKSQIHTDDLEDTIDNVRYLLKDAIRRQLISDVPICTFLSGGLDSSIITAVAANSMKEENGKQLDTYSFDYVDNDKYFTSSSFQPDEDRPYVERMADEFKTNHRYLFSDTDELVRNLNRAVEYKDLPGMADVDSSLLGFCTQVKENHVVAISGECADEVFGGYPWFHDPKVMNVNTFPWSPNLENRTRFLSQDILPKLNISEYVENKYLGFLSTMTEFPFQSEFEARQREINYLNLYWFMATLLDRKDRMSMASGLEVRVPFCDHRLISYVWNIPWEMKSAGGVRKSILREAAKGILPEDVRVRPKSPYPKTHNPSYEMMVKSELVKILDDKSSPILDIIDFDMVSALCKKDFDYGKPWFGQLMAGPQMIAYLIQVNHWLKTYKIKIEI